MNYTYFNPTSIEFGTGKIKSITKYIDKKFEEGTNILVEKGEKLKFHTADFMNEKFDNPRGSKELKTMDQRIFTDAVMGLNF